MRGATSRGAKLNHCVARFLLTRPMRGATLMCVRYNHTYQHFYSHAPCGARLSIARSRLTIRPFLLTRPMRGATTKSRVDLVAILFLLTRPMRGATATYSIRNSRTSYIQEADSKIITKYSIKFNILHDPAIKSRRTCLSFMHHNTFACYSP